jgi:UDP-N-acetylglucosamine/UDP-N-acetylgalactosamine diphosphorylase
MTSPATHDATAEFLDQHQRFGLPPSEVRLFCQAVMPTVDAATGKILMAARDQLSLSPDGHGGMLAALASSGCLADARNRGLELLFYGQVDNPLLQVCDPELIGHHLLTSSEMTTQVVAKNDPLDRVGNVADIDGRMQVIEYSDLPENAARRRNVNGSLYLWAGSIAVHVFDIAFLERMSAQAHALPFHRARKAVECLDERGRLLQHEDPNATKFERFIFDLMPAARNAVVVEAAAEEVFAPVKNAIGDPDETPETARAGMIRRDTALLKAAGIVVEPGVVVEVNPLWALDADDVARRLPAGQQVTEPTYFR